MAGCFSSSSSGSSRSPPLVRTSRPTIHQKPKRRSCGDTILGQTRTKSRVLDIEQKVTISSIDFRRRRSLDGKLAQGIGGETQRTRTPSIASRHSHSLKEDEDEGGGHDCFYCSRSSWLKKLQQQAAITHKSEFSFLVLPMDAFLFYPSVPSPRVV
jgi:hypothetical protein